MSELYESIMSGLKEVAEYFGIVLNEDHSDTDISDEELEELRRFFED
jgi:hypothetical protein